MFSFAEKYIPSYLKSRLGIYFHIPFCPHICPYCDFIKTSQFSFKDAKNYFEQLEIQLDYFLDILNYPKGQWITVYFGGGTPGLFEARFFEPLLHKLSKQYLIEECTLETNPFSNLERRFSDYKKIGINRITLGAQSLCENTLKLLGRKHTPQQIQSNIFSAQNAGIENIQVDLIYGLHPSIRKTKIVDEIYEFKKQGATGVSCYALTIEKRTQFGIDNLQVANDDVACEEYLEILKACQKLNWVQWESSNFSSSPPRHNTIYWSGLPYLGIGTGASGLLPYSKFKNLKQNGVPILNHNENFSVTLSDPVDFGIRYQIGKKTESYSPGNDILKYEKNEDIRHHFSIECEEQLRTKMQTAEELIFTRLRMKDGLPLKLIDELFLNHKFSENIQENLKIKRAIKENKLIIINENLIVDEKEKIRGDLWAVEVISCLF